MINFEDTFYCVNFLQGLLNLWKSNLGFLKGSSEQRLNSHSGNLGQTQGLAGNSKPIYEVCDSKSEKSAPTYVVFRGDPFTLERVRLDGKTDQPGSINIGFLCKYKCKKCLVHDRGSIIRWSTNTNIDWSYNKNYLWYEKIRWNKSEKVMQVYVSM